MAASAAQTAPLPSLDHAQAHSTSFEAVGGQANGIANGNGNANGHPPQTFRAYRPPLTDPTLYPRGKHTLSGISLRAFLLGLTLGFSVLTTILLAWHSHSVWRAPFFLSALSLFHFLEFWVTAEYNTTLATTAAFLLTSNGTAYNVAHSLAVLETVLSHTVFSYPELFPPVSQPSIRTAWLLSGFAMVLIGQVIRSLAMAQAGKNFNHTVQTSRRQEHELVTVGIYSVLRHPSYFGFWWWGIGTQVVLGNWVCLAGYVLVLWRFFRARIRKEEELLVEFFGKDYVDYRKGTHVGIPFIP